MNLQQTTGRPFTGKHMIVVMVAFFGVIISVNLVMASFARSSWTGLVVKNSYVASQQFNEKIAESRTLAALGWTGTLDTDAAHVRYRLTDKNGTPVPVTAGKAIFRHPAAEGADWTAVMKPTGGGHLFADAAVADGLWVVELEIQAGRDRPYRQSIRVVIRQGAVQ